MVNKQIDTCRDYAVKKVVAFAALIHARVARDDLEERRRTQELKTLGVQVEFTKPVVEPRAGALEADHG